MIFLSCCRVSNFSLLQLLFRQFSKSFFGPVQKGKGLICGCLMNLIFLEAKLPRVDCNLLRFWASIKSFESVKVVRRTSAKKELCRAVEFS